MEKQNLTQTILKIILFEGKETHCRICELIPVPRNFLIKKHIYLRSHLLSGGDHV